MTDKPATLEDVIRIIMTDTMVQCSILSEEYAVSNTDKLCKGFADYIRENWERLK